MSQLIRCPFCGKVLRTKLIADFWFCESCEVATREEDNMPVKIGNIYNESWIKAQEESRYILKRSYYLLAKIKELNGVRRILDIGCGTGILVDLLSRSGYTAVGIDSSPEAIEFAKRNKHGDYELASIESFQSQEIYDLIVAAQLIEHLRCPEIFLAKVKDLLKPRGYLLLETPNLNSWNKKSIWRRRIGGMFYGIDHRICYTPKSLTRLLCNNGFDVYKVITRTYSPTILTELITTLRLLLRNMHSESYYDKLACDGVSRNHAVKNACKNLIDKVIPSFIVDALLFVPERISEINNRGNQLIVIARKCGQDG
jgi:2-polyprenyl-3-methyl-5-hydroxy-6-metoxy-1,4-benzoquinol methylase